jgi:DNA-directed RNA polymerase beta' subunit
MVPKPALLKFTAVFFALREEDWMESLEAFLSEGGFKRLHRREIAFGSEALQTQLEVLNLAELRDFARKRWEMFGSTRAKKMRAEDQAVERERGILLRQIRLVEELLSSNIKPEWMVLTSLPVLPPGLRPLTEREDGELATSDLNRLYSRVIYRNNLLLEFFDLSESYMDDWTIVQRRQLQHAVTNLLDNGTGTRPPLRDRHDRRYKSFSDVIQGKEGRFRENLLGKRVDYSGRSVIVAGPSLALHQCGLPEEMARELFQPFVIRALMNRRLAPNHKLAKRMIKQAHPAVRDVLRSVIQGRPVLLNRAPTLHRLGVQSFQPVLTRERAIRLHPLVCTGFNADFDGDQMAVHVPLGSYARVESQMLMCSESNLLSPATGEAVAVPSQDMLLGLYVLTLGRQGGVYASRGEPSHRACKQVARAPMFANTDEALSLQPQEPLSPYLSLWIHIPPQTLVLSKNPRQSPLEGQYEPQGSKLHVYKHCQIRIPREARMPHIYLLTTLGRVRFNQRMREAVQGAHRASIQS